ncbi:hypothetical protein CGRA01v4_10001 [Colletotrichum graminicola]|uniref:DUF7730 domain-containing protein n=1 Tax=Colletotrichum graminicola (strain M1.001 / M2 / FGSC 10212) TaxID=645133 RepID=E3QHW7_COLGM|nr:uncharacterized protein GLRG_05599 [Colletotrichum graminicola M1.001]EFQ30455.1 hypothetical protein GLRG_05599 [Colletotrichum graminicola M1.001]WDK18715.1 hypothetical protein CGRA01v4_10001 [Colletotrichum graminicola]
MMAETRDACQGADVEAQLTAIDELGSRASTLDSQLQSSFFSRFPLEIRQSIYSYLWLAAGPTQHVYRSGASVLAPLSHCQCIADLDAEDIRETELGRLLNTPPADPAMLGGSVAPGSTDERDAITDWRFRLASNWCNHWLCEEEPPVLRTINDNSVSAEGADEEQTSPENGKNHRRRRQALVKDFSPFLAILLTCKRMHGEAVDSLYESTTFSFVGTGALSRFIKTTASESLARVSKLHLVWRAPIETYMALDADEAVAERTKWDELWTELPLAIPRLKELRIWAYPNYPRFPMPHDEWLLPLHQFGKVPKFRISFRWFQNPPTPDAGPLDSLEAAPFEYDRIPPMQEDPLYPHWHRLIGLPDVEPRDPVSRRQRKRRYVGRAL